MGDEHTWREVLHIIEGYRSPVVVVSATARTTRQLVAAAELALVDYRQSLSIAEEISRRHRLLISNFMEHQGNSDIDRQKQECLDWIERCITDLRDLLTEISEARTLEARKKDAVASIGEKLSSRLFAICGSVYGLDTCWIDAADIIRTDSAYGMANPDRSVIRSTIKQLAGKVEEGKLPVMGGYYGSDTEGNTTTLGFEGSDYSASLVGTALDAEAIEIWTDVSGIYTCDPRVVEEARPIQQLSFREATDLAYFGAKILHPSTMKPASDKGIPIRVKNIFEPGQAGTLIQNDSPAPYPARAMAYLEDIVIITVDCRAELPGYEFLADVFQILNTYHTPVDIVTTTEAAVSVALKHHPEVEEMIAELKALGTVEVLKEQGLISLIGCRVEEVREITENILGCIASSSLSMISYSEAKRNLNLVIPRQKLIETVNAVHRSLFSTPD